MEADVIVSTAIHEFFGISVVEAIAAGVYPVLPRRLSYPELLGEDNTKEFFYDGSVADLTERLRSLCQQLTKRKTLWIKDQNQAVNIVSRYQWSEVGKQLDTLIESIS
jgi:glycosyltransferase involved in cell wall biosynthesis